MIFTNHMAREQLIETDGQPIEASPVRDETSSGFMGEGAGEGTNRVTRLVLTPFSSN